jgi:predicted GNAT family N-acyltransferase
MVDNGLHKQGFGRELLAYRINEIRDAYPGHTMFLDTSQHTFPFFEKMGFKVVKVTNDYYGPGLDRYDMEIRF